MSLARILPWPALRLAILVLSFGLGHGARAQTFQEAAFLALAKDPRIASATAAANAQEARLLQIEAGGRPQLISSIDLNEDEGAQSLGTASLELSQELYSFGRLASSIEAAEESVTLAWIEVAQVNQDVIADVMTAYTNVLQADELVALRRAHRDELQQRSDAIIERIEAGLAGITELQALGRRVAEAEVALLRAEQQSEISRLELQRLTGEFVGRVEGRQLRRYIRLLPTSRDEAIFMAENNSPETLVSQQRFRIVDAEIKAQNRANNPSIQAYSTYSYSIEYAGEGSAANDEIGVRVSLPLIQGGLRSAVAQEGEQNREEALRLRQQDQLLIIEATAIAWTNVEIAHRAVTVWTRSVDLYQDQLIAIQNEVDADLATIADLLDVRSELVNTQAELITANYDVLRSQIILLRTLGLASLISDL